ncbi:OVARIAN TUMOR DOMAIN-containing deubiquitinating enzyme 3 isoform X1 [Elaeis guineensis]|uniref:Ubiquitin thioesterase OTU n=1 Tax=Elaeis guineensis var. tenera TaxID=51953 RepID=A0A6I9RMT0_ELAGV|nr:OTU domain-containing protein At3g57810 isoform X1 [Elaeis guineensis]
MACGRRPSNEVLLQQLRDGTAEFELLAPPTSPASNGLRFFARISSSLGGSSPAMKKVQHYSVQKVTGDGRCMFRALVKGMANNKGLALNPAQERDDADELRMAVKEIICDSDDAERLQYEEALIAITVEESLKRYCNRIRRSDFWGGESELLVLSKLCHQPIIVYIPEHEHTMEKWGNGFIPIAEYGSEFGRKSRKGKQRMPVRLLYSGKNHYDLLV